MLGREDSHRIINMKAMENVKERIEEIRVTAETDSEAAHSLEDDLYRDFVNHVAENCPWFDWRMQAREIRQTQEFKFVRHCA